MESEKQHISGTVVSFFLSVLLVWDAGPLSASFCPLPDTLLEHVPIQDTP